ncbi:FtsX-like permease family protein [Cellulosimicrobium marinum]|uniref:FtsX-like permease family protein n=1 Tax=Cellulosimicrobium marinum TaxID=1638992 RepID=UPI001E299FEA|nr:FtsX-like permease family protein [Cellulosimicrobium marinum]MCB7135945.1 hypothetical protein [Cellulosimicrobium marinum]
MTRLGVLLLGVRLLRAGGPRRWWSRLLVVAGVAMAVVGTLVCVAAATVVHAQSERTWDRSFTSATDGASAQARVTVSRIAYEDRMLLRVDVDPLDGALPLPPGVDRWPGPGEVVLSPAARALTDVDAFRALVPGTAVGTVADAGLRGPDELVAYRGVLQSEQPRGGEAVVAPGAPGAGAHDRDTPDVPSGQVAALVALLAVLVGMPVAAFLGVATRLSASTRARRLAVLQFLGAPDATVRAVNTVEVVTLSVVGWVCGLAVFPWVNSLVAGSGFLGTTWFTEDTALTPATAVVPGGVLVLLAVLAGRRVDATTTTRAGLRSADPARAVSAWRLAPLLLGLTSLTAQVVVGAQRPAGAAPVRLDLVMSAAVLVTAIGLAVATPWVVRRTGLLLAARGRSVAARLGGSRAAFDPRDGARLVVALTLLVMAAGVTIGQTRDARAVSVPVTAVVPVSVDASELPPGGTQALAERLAGPVVGLAASDPSSPRFVLAAVATCDQADAWLAALGGARLSGCEYGSVLTSGLHHDARSVGPGDVPALAPVAGDLPLRGELPEGAARLLAEDGVDLLVTLDPALVLDAVPRGPQVDASGATVFSTNALLVAAVPRGDLSTALAAVYDVAPYSQPTAVGLDPDSGRTIAMTNGFIRLGLLLGALMTALALAVALADRVTTRRRADTGLLAAGAEVRLLRAAHRWEAVTTLGSGALLAFVCGTLGGLAWQYAGGLVREPDWPAVLALGGLTAAAVLGVALAAGAAAPRSIDPEALRST